MSTRDPIDLRPLLKEFADKPEFEGLVLDYQKHTGREMHELLAQILDDYWGSFKDPYSLMEIVFRLARKTATVTTTLEKHASDKHEVMKQEGRADELRFHEIISHARVKKAGKKPAPTPRGATKKETAAQPESRPEKPQKRGKMKVTVLFLAANPRGTDPLRLDQEIRDIDTELQKAPHGGAFDLKSDWAVQVEDLQGIILRRKPGILHFSGHGSRKSEIVLENRTGTAQAVPSHALAKMFEILAGLVRCVVLNACYSEAQARAISQHVDCVVGMDGSIGDVAAIAFATAFYRALAHGMSIKKAFDLGCSQIALQDLKEEHKPKILTKPGIEPDTIHLL